MKTIDEIIIEFCSTTPPGPIPELCNDELVVSRMSELSKKLHFEQEDLFELCACAGIGAVACWERDYKFCRSGGISQAKLYQDAALLGLMSEEGVTIREWAEERLPSILEEVHDCETQEVRDQLWMAYCCAAYRYGMAFEQLVLNVETA